MPSLWIAADSTLCVIGTGAPFVPVPPMTYSVPPNATTVGTLRATFSVTDDTVNVPSEPSEPTVAEPMTLVCTPLPSAPPIEYTVLPTSITPLAPTGSDATVTSNAEIVPSGAIVARSRYRCHR